MKAPDPTRYARRPTTTIAGPQRASKTICHDFTRESHTTTQDCSTQLSFPLCFSLVQHYFSRTSAQIGFQYQITTHKSGNCFEYLCGGITPVCRWYFQIFSQRNKRRNCTIYQNRNKRIWQWRMTERGQLTKVKWPLIGH